MGAAPSSGGCPMGRIRQFTVSAVLTLAAFVAVPAGADAAGCGGADAMPATMSAAAANHATLCLLNQQRRAHGLRALRADRKLRRAAAGHARDMVNRHFFAHDSLNGTSFSTRIARTGWTRARRSWTVGENIGWGD